jgi:hypothetical protein
MKKIIIGSIVGGVLIFLWQFLSWGVGNFHRPVQNYTDKQDAIMSFLNSQNLEEGGYILPSLPRDAKPEDWEGMMKETEGKPWATIQYHKELNHDMAMRIVRALLVDILTVYLLCWLLRRFNVLTFTNILTASLVIGLIVFLNVPYTHSIWYEDHDTWISLLDAIASWGLVGLWLGWWLTRRRDPIVHDRATVRA